MIECIGLLGNQSDEVFDLCCWGSVWELAILNQEFEGETRIHKF